MKSLVTVTDAEEADLVAKAGPDILDIKNPEEGSLGAPTFGVVRDIMEVVPDGIETSVAVGDVPMLPGTVSLAVHGAARMEPDYIKLGLHGPTTAEEAFEVVRAAVEASGSSKLVVAGYADYEDVGCVPVDELPEVAEKAGADAVMVDTFRKNTSLLDHIPPNRLSNLAGQAQDKGLNFAVAGSLSIPEVSVVGGVGVDVVGVRGAVCKDGERTRKIDFSKVERFLSQFS